MLLPSAVIALTDTAVWILTTMEMLLSMIFPGAARRFGVYLALSQVPYEHRAAVPRPKVSRENLRRVSVLTTGVVTALFCMAMFGSSRLHLLHDRCHRQALIVDKISTALAALARHVGAPWLYDVPSNLVTEFCRGGDKRPVVTFVFGLCRWLAQFFIIVAYVSFCHRRRTASMHHAVSKMSNRELVSMVRAFNGVYEGVSELLGSAALAGLTGRTFLLLSTNNARFVDLSPKAMRAALSIRSAVLYRGCKVEQADIGWEVFVDYALGRALARRERLGQCGPEMV